MEDVWDDQFLIDRKSAKLAKIDTEIKTIKDKLSANKDSDEYRERSQSLLKVLEKEDKDQKFKKKKKYNRDLNDYCNNMVFDWQKRMLEDLAGQTNTEMEGSIQGFGENSGGPLRQPQLSKNIKKGPLNKTQKGLGPQRYQSPQRPVGATKPNNIPPHHPYNSGPPRSNYGQRGGGSRYIPPPPWTGSHHNGGRGRGLSNPHRGRGYNTDYPEWWRPNQDYDSFQKPPYQDLYVTDWEYNLPIQNRFFPMSDMNPYEGVSALFEHTDTNRTSMTLLLSILSKTRLRPVTMSHLLEDQGLGVFPNQAKV